MDYHYCKRGREERVGKRRMMVCARKIQYLTYTLDEEGRAENILQVLTF